jgi:hypothetical protein
MPAAAYIDAVPGRRTEHENQIAVGLLTMYQSHVGYFLFSSVDFMVLLA